ncbi:MAG: MFS transporter [Acidimicrobiia bacterium]|nr:MFS transporter [Acidimicrobiia bacterium]
MQRLLHPRSDVVVEVMDDSAHGEAPPDAPAAEAAFGAVDGPFDHYRRTVHILERGDEECLVRQHISYRLSVPVWGWFITPLANRELRRPRRDGTQPFWAPAERLDARSGQVLGVLCLLSVVAGYLGTLLSQTITFAFDEFDAGLATQGNTLAAVRVGVLIALARVVLAERGGRRRILRSRATGGCLIAAAGAASVGVWSYGASQMVSRSLSTAMFVLLVVISAEEVPAGARAYAVSVLTLAAGLGSGMVVWLLPLADLGLRGWRTLFLAPLLALPLLLFCARRLPESRRFRRPQAPLGDSAAPQPAAGMDRGPGVHGGGPGEAATGTGSADRPVPGPGAQRRARRTRRLTLLGVGALLFSMFSAPASQFLNEFLRSERAFSASDITVFQLSINTPAAIGVLIGGRFSDVRGRRRIGAVGLVAAAVFIVLRYAQGGWPMWMWGVLAGIFGAATVPVMGAFGGELFGTASRARSNGQITVLGVLGSVIGLQIVGRFTDAGGDFWQVFAMVAGAPLALALLVLWRFPETASRVLEDLNPEDRDAEPPPSAAG